MLYVHSSTILSLPGGCVTCVITAAVQALVRGVRWWVGSWCCGGWWVDVLLR